MSPIEFFRFALFTIHLLAAAAWVGGSIFYLAVIRTGESSAPARSETFRQNFKEFVQTCIILLVVTGTILTFDRLALNPAGALYVGLLGLKIGLAIAMFILAVSIWRRPLAPTKLEAPIGREQLRPVVRQSLILVIGITIFILATALRLVWEAGIRTM